MKNKLQFPFWIIIIGSLIFFQSCKEKDNATIAPPSINVVEVIQKDVPKYNYFVGQVFGQEDVAINARVEGFLEKMHFTEGSRIEKGTLLYSIDPEPFKANVASQKSKVAEAQTRYVNAQNELERYIPLAKIDAVSKSDLDFAQASRDASLAAVEAAKASLRLAEINLSYTSVKSPISGFIGKTQARVGEFVGRSPNPVILNTVSTINNVRVQFFLTEKQYLLLAREFIARDSVPRTEEEKMTISLLLADGTTHKHAGIIDFINREVDSQTGAILVQASFPNPELLLRPGQFARVQIMTTEKDAFLVPQRCVKEIQGQYSVFVVNDANKVEARQISIKENYGDYYTVSEGLNLMDKIVLDGLQKVGSGMEVIPEVIAFESQTIVQ